MQAQALTVTTTGPIPRSRVAVAVDAVGSSSLPDDQLDPLTGQLEAHLAEALERAGLHLVDAEHPRETGDGVMLSFPEEHAARLVELVFHLDHVLRWRNRDCRVPLRARIALHCGPMAEYGRYHRPYIVATRLLQAPAFTAAVRHCMHRDRCGDKLGAALIVSRWMWHNVIEPFRAPLVPPARCAAIRADIPSYHDDAWIHLPGTDADTALTNLPATVTSTVPTCGQDATVTPSDRAVSPTRSRPPA